MCKILVAFVLSATGLLVVLLALNTVASRQRRFTWDMSRKDPTLAQLDRERIGLRAQRLAKSLTIQTISWERDVFETQALLDLHQHLEKSFPLVHSSPLIQVNVINGYSLLYKVGGSNDENGALPFMLTAHLDVVPVANGTWKVDPFQGAIIDGIIYGRGALDDKASVMGILEALEFLLENNYSFQRTFYIGFGHDEEVSGFEGAGHIAKHLKKNGVDHLDFVLDEGYFVLEDFVEGVDELVSVIGVTEKGYATLELSVEMNPGHSSIPPRETSIGVLAKAVAALEANPHPSVFGQGPEMDFFSYMAPFANIGHSFIFSNLWIMAPLLSKILARSSVTDAIQRTTTAVTIIQGGYKSNVIPGSASATVNHRIHPAESLEQVIEYNRQVINDPRVRIKVVEYYPPVPISPYGQDVLPFNLIASSIKQIYPTSVITPACSPANTDLRRYTELSNHLYRIAPTILTPKTRDGIHGDNEQISVEDYHNLIRFYVTLMVDADHAAGRQDRNPVWHHRDL